MHYLQLSLFRAELSCYCRSHRDTQTATNTTRLYVPTCTHYIHRYIPPHVHTYIHRYMDAHIHTFIRLYILWLVISVYMYMCLCVIVFCIYIHIIMLIQRHAHMYAHVGVSSGVFPPMSTNMFVSLEICCLPAQVVYILDPFPKRR